MKLIIFIGHFKTGSTSIQNFLAANYRALLHRGILYPSVESRGAAHNLRALARGIDGPVERAGLNVIEPHNALALRLKNEEDGHGVPDYYPHLPSGFQMLEMLVNQISALDPRITILCAEVFALLGMTKDRSSIQRLHNRLGHHEVTIYCNLRRPDEHLSSWHRQRLKFKEKLHRLESGALLPYLDTAHVQYAAMIQGWLDYFPKAQLVLRNYDDVKSAGGSINDFIESTALSLPADVYLPGMLNPSIPAAFAEIGRRALWELPEKEASQVIDWLIAAAKYVRHEPDKEIEVFGAQGREMLATRFRDVSEEIDELSGRRPFFSDIEDLGSLRPVSQIDAAQRALPPLVKHARRCNLPVGVMSWISDLRLEPAKS